MPCVKNLAGGARTIKALTMSSSPRVVSNSFCTEQEEWVPLCPEVEKGHFAYKALINKEYVQSFHIISCFICKFRTIPNYLTEPTQQVLGVDVQEFG